MSMTRLMRVFIALFGFLLAAPVAAQNLVPNPGFEAISSCPDNRGAINRAPPWANLPSGQWVYEFSDYFNACSANVPVPLNWAGNQLAHGGSAYAGLYTGGPQDALPRSYIQAPLLGQLVAGAPYKVSFYVALAHLSGFASDGIGAYFSTGPVVAVGSSLPAAQVSNPSGNILDEHWRLVQGQFIAHGGEDHILIGNFRDAAHTNTAANNNTNGMGMAFYYVDDVSVELQPDLAIEKAVSRPSPQQNQGYTFQLTVKSPGAPFNGHGIITVTDYAPPGVSFSGVPTAVYANDWNCTLTPSTVTCVYIGTGPTASNQTIGTITFSGAATHLPLPPLTKNCARVELYQTSGHVDGNPANNQSCAVLPGQREICAPPTVANPFPPPRCVCPRGTVASGNGCATVRTCVAPRIRDPKSGACHCPSGKVERNGNCLTPGTNSYCKPPKAPGPTPRSCLCPSGTVASGDTCVAARQDCRPPRSRDPKSGACLCPVGTQPRGQECVRTTACVPPAKLDGHGVCEPGATMPRMAPRVSPSGPGRTNGRNSPYDKH